MTLKFLQDVTFLLKSKKGGGAALLSQEEQPGQEAMIQCLLAQLSLRDFNVLSQNFSVKQISIIISKKNKSKETGKGTFLEVCA